GVGDEGGVGEAVRLHDRRARAARAGGGAGLVEEVVGGQVQAQGDAHARVHAGGDLGGPVPGPGQRLGCPGGEREPGGVGGGRGGGQGVGDGVVEGAHQRLGLGQADRAGAGQGYGVSLV